LIRLSETDIEKELQRIFDESVRVIKGMSSDALRMNTAHQQYITSYLTYKSSKILKQLTTRLLESSKILEELTKISVISSKRLEILTIVLAILTATNIIVLLYQIFSS